MPHLLLIAGLTSRLLTNAIMTVALVSDTDDTARSAYLYDGFYSSHKRQTGETFPRTGSAPLMKRNDRKSRTRARDSSFSPSSFLSLSRCRVVGLKMRKRDDEFIDCLSTRGKALKQLSPNGGRGRGMRVGDGGSCSEFPYRGRITWAGKFRPANFRKTSPSRAAKFSVAFVNVARLCIVIILFARKMEILLLGNCLNSRQPVSQPRANSLSFRLSDENLANPP